MIQESYGGFLTLHVRDIRGRCVGLVSSLPRLVGHDHWKRLQLLILNSNFILVHSMMMFWCYSVDLWLSAHVGIKNEEKIHATCIIWFLSSWSGLHRLYFMTCLFYCGIELHVLSFLLWSMLYYRSYEDAYKWYHWFQPRLHHVVSTLHTYQVHILCSPCRQDLEYCSSIQNCTWFF